MNCTLKQLLLVATVIVVGRSSYCSAQVTCSGVISGTIANSIVCSGDCTLDNATILGNVECSSGNFLAKGNSSITGNILLISAITRAEFDFVTVLGGVEVNEATSLTELVIKQTATLGSVKVENTPGDVVVAGSVGNLELIFSGDLFVNNLITNASVLVKGGNGVIDVCGSSLGGLSVEEHEGNIEIDASNGNCDPTTLIGGLSANKGTGSVTVRGAAIPSGDFLVAEYTGDVILQEVQLVSDVKLEKNSGSLTIRDVSTDSDTSISGQVGNVVLRDLSGLGDFAVKEVNGDVDLRDSSFTSEDISIILVTGAVTAENNTDLNLTVEETGGMVRIIGNVIDSGNVNKNTGGVEISGNNIIFLSCTDNIPAPFSINGNLSLIHI